MYDRVIPAKMLAEFMDLGMTVVTAGNTVISPCCLDLFVFYLSECQALIFES